MKLPLDQLGDSTAVNKWIYLDLDITLAEDETLAFGGKNNTVIWAWKSGYSDTAYSFRDAKGGSTKGIFFDIYTETVLTYADYQNQLKEEEERLEAEKERERIEAELKSELADKGISILGDSISTFTGWSNNTSYNSTIGGNAIYYNGSTDGFSAVNETWWMQAITRSGLDLVVNNSWSGDCVTARGISRALQLHNNEGRDPDIIAVYLGINDFRTKVTVEEFAIAYEEMISGMLRKYVGSDVYLFTLLYTTNVNSGVDPANVVWFNEVIRDVASRYNCTLVDIYSDTGITPENLATYMGDKRLHPNYAGMDLITDCFMDALIDKYVINKRIVTDVFYEGEVEFNVGEGSPMLELKVSYSDGSVEYVDVTNNMYITGDGYSIPDFSTAGSYKVKIEYQDFNVTLNIYVTDPDACVLIPNEEFLYGSYFDHTNGNTDRITSGAYGLIRSADALLPAQDITIKVSDTNLTNYKVTLGYYDANGNYKGKTGILPMVDGMLTIKASEMTHPYFRVNVYIYNPGFVKVPESAEIVVYGKTSDLPENRWEDKKITIVGDSISTGGYVGTLGNMTGASIQNLSVSGTKLVGGISGKVQSIDADSDLIIIFGGTNDYWHKNTAIGDSDSPNTFVGALKYIWDYINENHPDAEILFVFPPDQTFGGKPSSTDFGYGTLDDFRAAFLDFCNENNVQYVNLAETEFDPSKHSGDGVHPNSAGHQIIAEAIYTAIN